MTSPQPAYPGFEPEPRKKAGRRRAVPWVVAGSLIALTVVAVVVALVVRPFAPAPVTAAPAPSSSATAVPTSSGSPANNAPISRIPVECGSLVRATDVTALLGGIVTGPTTDRFATDMWTAAWMQLGSKTCQWNSDNGDVLEVKIQALDGDDELRDRDFSQQGSFGSASAGFDTLGRRSAMECGARWESSLEPSQSYPGWCHASVTTDEYAIAVNGALRDPDGDVTAELTPFISVATSIVDALEAAGPPGPAWSPNYPAGTTTGPDCARVDPQGAIRAALAGNEVENFETGIWEDDSYLGLYSRTIHLSGMTFCRAWSELPAGDVGFSVLPHGSWAWEGMKNSALKSGWSSTTLVGADDTISLCTVAEGSTGVATTWICTYRYLRGNALYETDTRSERSEARADGYARTAAETWLATYPAA